MEGKKEKVAILISYSGADYYGLAHNKSDHEHVTIEQRVFEVCQLCIMLNRKFHISMYYLT